MKLLHTAIRTATLCVAFALAGCTTAYDEGYHKAYKAALKGGKSEFEARRIAERAGDEAAAKDEADKAAEAARMKKLSDENMKNMQAQAAADAMKGSMDSLAYPHLYTPPLTPVVTPGGPPPPPPPHHKE